MVSGLLGPDRPRDTSRVDVVVLSPATSLLLAEDQWEAWL